VRDIAAAVEEDFDVERVRETSQCRPVVAEGVLLGDVVVDPRQRTIGIEVVDLEAAELAGDVDVEAADAAQRCRRVRN